MLSGAKHLDDRLPHLPEFLDFERILSKDGLPQLVENDCLGAFEKAAVGRRLAQAGNAGVGCTCTSSVGRAGM
jgi:hypothetical protein